MKKPFSPITLPLSHLYRAAVSRRNARFDRGKGVERISRPVISIGNITVGGTGKTPLVAWIVRELLDTGHRPAIAMRGYAAKRGEMSDEQAEYADSLGDVPVIAAPDRVEALSAFLATPEGIETDCIVLDDGFQHRRLHRDCDLVLIDATQNTFGDRVLPAGRLREPIKALARADGVIVTRAGQVDTTLGFRITQSHGREPLAWCDHEWPSISLHGRDQREVPPDWLNGKKVVSMLGVGNPGAVEAMIANHGAMIRRRFPVADHADYDSRHLDAVHEACAHPQIDALIVTRKDWVKLRHLTDWSSWPTPVAVPVLKIDFLTGEERLRQRVFETIDSFQPGEPAEAHVVAAGEPGRADE